MKYAAPIIQKVRKNRFELVCDWVTPYGTIPAGAISNGANVNRSFWWFFSPFGELFEAAIFHDYYYENALETKSYADKSFYKIAIDFDVNKHKAKMAYWAVKHFGSGSY